MFGGLPRGSAVPHRPGDLLSVSLVSHRDQIKEKLGLKEPWKICSAMVLGYPKFKQDGVVPREYRPVTWFREGAEGPEIEE